MFEALKKTAVDDIDPNRFSIIERQLNARQSEAHENRRERERLMQAQNAINENKQRILHTTGHTKAQLEECDAQLKEISELLQSVDARYRDLSEEMKPVIAFHNGCKDFILASGLKLPGVISGNAPQVITRRFQTLRQLSKPASTKGPAAATLAGYHAIIDKRKANSRESARVENQPTARAEIIEAWDKNVDDAGARGRASTQCDNLPPRDRLSGSPELFPSLAVIESTGTVRLDPLSDVLCAVFPDEIKKFIRSVNQPNSEEITTSARKAKLAALHEERTALDWELERCARSIEGEGIEVVRPGDLDPRVFLTRTV